MKVLLIALLFAAQQPDDVLRQVNEASVLVDEGKVDEAIAALKQILAAHPESDAAKYELALAYSAAGDSENCRKIAEPLAETEKNQVQVLGLLGNCYDELGQHDKAVATYRRGLKLAPSDAQLSYNLAVTLAAQRKVDEARELLKADTRANPWHASGHFALAKIFEAQDFRTPAVMSYLHFLALEVSPRSKEAAERLQKLLDRGVETTKEGANITIDPDTPKAEGDYGPMEMMLAIVSSGRLITEKVKLSEFERRRDQVASVIRIFIEQADKHDDYTAAVQRPFFAAMEKEKLVDTFAAIAIIPLHLDGAKEWGELHRGDITRFSKWIVPQTKRPGVMLRPK